MPYLALWLAGLRFTLSIYSYPESLCFNTKRILSDTILLPFLNPEHTEWISAPAIVVLFIIRDLIGLRRGKYGPQGSVKTDFIAHIAGYAIGFGASRAVYVPVKRQQQKERRSLKSINIEMEKQEFK